MILSFFYPLGLLVAVAHATAPQVQIGKTTLVGLDITGFKLDFFGGMIFTIMFPIRRAEFKAVLQGFLSPSLPSVICVCNHPFSKHSLM
jgi:hypothetical protein